MTDEGFFSTTACQKFSLKYFRELLKIQEIHEIKDLYTKFALYSNT